MADLMRVSSQSTGSCGICSFMIHLRRCHFFGLMKHSVDALAAIAAKMQVAVRSMDDVAIFLHNQATEIADQLSSIILGHSRGARIWRNMVAFDSPRILECTRP